MESFLEFLVCFILFFSTVEQFVGILLSSILLGVIILRANSPSQRLIFSNKACVVARDRKQTLLIRIASVKGVFCIQPEIRLAYVHRLVTKEGEDLLKTDSLEVRRGKERKVK